jgi:hypothetical protein
MRGCCSLQLQEPCAFDGLLRGRERPQRRNRGKDDDDS